MTKATPGAELPVCTIGAAVCPIVGVRALHEEVTAGLDPRRSKVLIVEDEGVVALDIQAQVQGLGYRVVGTAASGTEAIEKTWALDPDVVLMDIRLQGEMDGVTAAEQIHRSSDVPVIFVTAFADEATVRRVEADDPSGYLLKPFDERELGVAIHAALRQTQLNQRIRSSELWFAAILRGVADAVIAADAGGRVQFMNPQAERLTGWRREDATGAAVEAVLGCPDPPAYSRGSTPTLMRWSTAAADGSVQRLEAEVAPLCGRCEQEAVTGVVWIVRDTTQRDRLEAGRALLADAGALLGATLGDDQVLEQVLRLLVRDLADFAVLDRYQRGGPAIETTAVHSDPRKEKALRRWLRAGGGAARLRQMVAGVLVTNEPASWSRSLAEEKTALAATRGREIPRPQAAAVFPLLGRGRTLGALTVVSTRPAVRYHDLDLALLEELAHRVAVAVDNTELYEEAQRALRMRDDVLAIVSHDLRTPLASISAAATLLFRGADLPDDAPDAQQRARAILHAVTRMTRLLDDLGDVASIDAGRLRLRPRERLRAADLVGELAQMFEPLAAQASRRLIVEAPPPEVEVACDRERIFQVLANLVANAMKFTVEGDRITLRAEAKDDEVRFSVTDTGQGMDAEQLPRVFDRYWQAPATARRGSGLGLFIAKGIVEAHGGRIGVTSAPGAGSCFHFTLPRAPPGE